MSSGFSCKPIKRSANLAFLLALGVFLTLLAAALLSAAAAQDDLAAERVRDHMSQGFAQQPQLALDERFAPRGPIPRTHLLDAMYLRVPILSG